MLPIPLKNLVGTKAAGRKHMLDNVLADTMPPLSDWPWWVRERFLSQHLTFGGRCCIVYFCLGNGMPPTVLADWCMTTPGYLRDRAACQHMIKLIESHQKGEFDGSTGKEAKTVLQVNGPEPNLKLPAYTPHFARDEQPLRITLLDDFGQPSGVEYAQAGSTYWRDAITKLKGYSDSLPR